MGGQQISARGTALGKHTVDTKAKGHTPTSDPRPSKSGIFHLLKGPPKSLQKNAYYEYKLYMNLIPLHQNKLFFKLPIFLTNFLRYPPMLTFVVPKYNLNALRSPHHAVPCCVELSGELRGRAGGGTGAGGCRTADAGTGRW